MTTVCKKCKQKIDLTRSKLEIKLISREPVFSRIDVTCCHCGECQTFSVMDQEQMTSMKQYISLQKQIAIAKAHKWRASTIAKMQSESSKLLSYMQDREPYLLDVYWISQCMSERLKKKGVKRNGQE